MAGQIIYKSVSVGIGIATTGNMLDHFYAFRMAKEHYQICKKLKLPAFLQDQLLRASSSVGLNLAEGSGKRTPEDQRKFYATAFGSLRECQAILELENIDHPHLLALTDELAAVLYTLSRKNLNSPTNP